MDWDSSYDNHFGELLKPIAGGYYSSQAWVHVRKTSTAKYKGADHDSLWLTQEFYSHNSNPELIVNFDTTVALLPVVTTSQVLFYVMQGSNLLIYTYSIGGSTIPLTSNTTISSLDFAVERI